MCRASFIEKKRERNMTGDTFMSPVMCRASITEKEREKEGNRGSLDLQGPPKGGPWKEVNLSAVY